MPVLPASAPRKNTELGINMKNKKSLGQHWLYNRAILNDIASLAQAPNTNICVEIGPGLGTLTSSLFKSFQKVIAIEYDADLARKLPGSFPGKDLEVIQADVLQADIPSLVRSFADAGTSTKVNDSADVGAPTKANNPANTQAHSFDVKSPASIPPYSIAGNIPYYITSPIVKKVINLSPAPAVIVLLMQKEVAERIAAGPGDYNLLALQTQNRARVTLGPVVKAAEFTPPPKVDSQVLIIEPLPAPQVDESCLQLAQIGFSSPRKKLAGNLAAANFITTNLSSANLSSANLSITNSTRVNNHYSRDQWRQLLADSHINPDARPGDLTLQDWDNLYQAAVK